MSTDTQAITGLAAVAIDQIHPSPNNPRENLTGLDELAVSIRENGLIQPLVVQRIPGQDGVQIVAGHRRHAAIRKLGWAKAPCIIRRDMLPDEELLGRLALLALPLEEQEELRAGAVAVGAAISKARADSGKVRTPKKGLSSPVHLGPLHDLARQAKARCQRMHSGRKRWVGGTACGECWESVIRADERQHLHTLSEQRGRCVLCDTTHDADRAEAV